MDERRLSAVLVDFARTLTADFSIQTTLDHVVRSVLEVIPVTGAGVLLMPTEHDHHFVAATDDVIRSIEGLQMDLGEGPGLTASRTGERVAVPDLRKDGAFPRFSRRAVAAGLGAVSSFPLRLDEDRIGALELYTAAAVDLPEDDLVGAQVLADVIAAYVGNARFRSDAQQAIQLLEAQALHDPLTGLPNRMLLNDRLSMAIGKTERRRGFCGVLFVDVDNLKSINDTFGHRAGDVVLKGIARRLRGAIRPGDTVARLAGDEFVVICEDLTQAAQAEEVAARVLEALHEPFAIRPGATSATVSIGIAFARHGQTSASQVLALADTAMYQAKALGGSCWVTAHGPARRRRAAPRVTPAAAAG